MEGGQDQTWFNWLVGGIIALLSYLARHIWNKVELMQEQRSELVTRDELEKYFATLRAERLQQHAENGQRLDRIDNAVVRLHSRIDQAFDK